MLVLLSGTDIGVSGRSSKGFTTGPSLKSLKNENNVTNNAIEYLQIWMGESSTAMLRRIRPPLKLARKEYLRLRGRLAFPCNVLIEAV